MDSSSFVVFNTSAACGVGTRVIRVIEKEVKNLPKNDRQNTMTCESRVTSEASFRNYT